MMNMIQVFNRAISDAVNKEDSFYETWIGADPFTPEITIIDSGDFNCGAVCNELEFARTVTDYIVAALSIEGADDEELNDLINGFIDLPRRGAVEADETFRKRFDFLVVEQVNTRRTTRWAILDALRYFIADVDNDVQLIEPWDSNNCYFQLRFEGILSTEDIIFLNNLSTGWLNQNFLGGLALGSVITYIGDLVSRIKAAGVDFDMLFITQDRFTLDSDAFIGTIQRYLDVDVVIKVSISFTKTSDAEIV